VQGRAQLETNAEGEDLVDLRANEGPRQSILGDAEPHHPPGLLRSLEHRHGVTEQGEVVRGGEAGRPGPDDGDRTPGRVALRHVAGHRQMPGVPVAFVNQVVAQAVLGVRARRFDTEALGGETFERANRDGRVDRAAAAGVLARRRTHAAADGRQRIGGAGDEVGLLVPPLGNQLDVPPGIRRDRAPRLALDLVLPLGQVGQADTNGHRPLPATARDEQSEPRHIGRGRRSPRGRSN